MMSTRPNGDYVMLWPLVAGISEREREAIVWPLSVLALGHWAATKDHDCYASPLFTG